MPDGRRKMRRPRRMPGEKWLRWISDEALWEARGEIIYQRLTCGVSRWIRILEAPGVPRLCRNEVVCLSGRANNVSLSLGMCETVNLRGRRLWVILLDDLDRRMVKKVNRAIRRHMPGCFDRRFLEKVWDGYMLQTFLHELGHALYQRRAGFRGSDGRHEYQAERFAWRALERVLPRKIVLGVLAMQWMLEITR